MPRGFGRGAKSVGIVTHAQAKKAGKKTPRGLRGNRQKKRARYQKGNDEQVQLEKSLGLDNESSGRGEKKTLAQQIAGIYIPHIINKRQKGLRSLRKDLLTAVKNINRTRSQKKGKK